MLGIPVSSGISSGNVYMLDAKQSVSDKKITQDEVKHEIQRFKDGRVRAEKELASLIKKVRVELGEDKAEIFEGHLEILSSEDVEDEVIGIITEQLVHADKASDIFAELNAKDMEELDDEYMRERAHDIRDIGRQLIKGIQGSSGAEKPLPSNAIIVAHELTPSQTASLDMTKVKGFIVQTGGKNSHAAIIARSLEIPAIILGDQDLSETLNDTDTIFIDGDSGEMWINPEDIIIKELDKRDKKNKKERAELLELLDLPAVTLDNQKMGLYANVGGTGDIKNAVKYKADGIGLFRSEFLFMETMSSPSLARQTEVYKTAVKAMNGNMVIIRLLDTGADKPLPYWPLPKEDNPFLGIRGIRLLFQKEDILRTQIQALLNASVDGPVGMMIPMIGSLKPIERVRVLIEEEKKALDWKGPDNLSLGVMVETPAAVQLIEEILDAVDFVSIGTNDLTQYTLAADRGNPLMSEYYDEFHPAVLRSIAHVIKKANKKGKLNGICGEFAGNTLALPFFVGLGVEELSTNAASLLKMKKIIRKINASEARELVKEILRIPTTEGIKARLSRFLSERDLLK
ncbi:MAG: phosphoenolpyruvate--protein phosphotransferase [Spirochaetaceae bacterium]